MYLFKVKLDENKSVISGFRKIYGIGGLKSKRIRAILGLNSRTRLHELDHNDMSLLERKLIDELNNLELELYRKQYYAIKHFIDINSYRGFCHKNGLPVNGQRTHTNASTQAKLFRTRLELRKW